MRYIELKESPRELAGQHGEALREDIHFVNEVGVARAGVSAHHQGYRLTDGTTGGMVGSQVARTARNLDDVYDIMSSHRIVKKFGIRLCADRHGEAVLIEGTADEKFRTRVDAEFAYSTGIYIGGTSHSIRTETPLDNAIALYEVFLEYQTTRPARADGA